MSEAAAAADTDEFMQDNVVMTRMISLLTTMMEQELRIRENLYAEKKEIHEELRRNFFCRRDCNTKVIRGNNGKRYHVLCPTHKQLAEM
jgi:hypothetical protein